MRDPPPLTPGSVAALQQGAGNAVVARHIQRATAARGAPRASSAPRERHREHVEGVIFWAPDGAHLYRHRDRKSNQSIGPLRHGAPIFVVDRDAGAGSSLVTTPQGHEGYVASKVVKTDLPCPGARIHLVEAGETALDDIVPKYFTHDEKPGRDGRYYVNVLAYLNPASMVDPSVKNWRKVEFKTNFSIWIPTSEFANSLRHIVKSGSITGGKWAQATAAVRKVVGVVVGAAAFVYGALRGVVDTVKDTLSGLGALIGDVIDLLRSLVTGHILDDVKKLWGQIRDLPRAMGAEWRQFKGQWNAKNPWDRWAFRGELLGRAITEVALTVLSGGVAAILSGTSKLARLTALVSRLESVQKLEHAVRKGSHKIRNLRAALLTKHRPKRPKRAAEIERASRAKNARKEGSGTPRADSRTNRTRQMRRNVKQRELCDRLIGEAEGKGAYDIRVDQTQVEAVARDEVGARLGNNRPDLQYTDRRGRRHIVEFDSFDSTRGRQHLRDALANDPKAIIELWQEVRVRSGRTWKYSYVKVF